MRHGRGIMTYQNQDSYEGEWQQDKRIGYGVFMMRGKGTYQGEW